MSHLRNYLVLDGDPDRAMIRIADHRETKKTITDPVTNRLKEVHVLELVLSWADGHDTGAVYSVTSDREFAMWRPYLADRSYVGKTFEVTKTGKGFLRQTSIKVMPGA